MKTNIPTPIIVIIVIAVVAVAGLVFYKGTASSSPTDVVNAAKSINQGKPSTQAVSQEEASSGMQMMGGKKGAR